MKRWCLLLSLCLCLLLVTAATVAQDDDDDDGAASFSLDNYIRSDRLGITFVSSADHPADDERYRQALLLGAGWNRWPLYWNRVEVAPGQFDWSDYDRVVIDDVEHGLNINAILIGIPEFYKDGRTFLRIAVPVFSDGTNVPGADKTINPDNPWANYVYEAVMRYKPGGVLAQQEGWTNGEGIRVWEAWNEPDLEIFWQGSVTEYAQLLKMTYLTAHHAYPDAEVMFGGLAYINPDARDYLGRTLDIYFNDPLAQQNNWFMDIVAVHNYSNSWRSGYVVRWAKRRLANYNLDKPVWLNESGIPVWNDYPGPIWTGDAPDQRELRGTMTQQAAFFIQSTAYAWAAGAEVVFFHQLYDDCGNQPAGTDFPPHNGEFCSQGACWGDAHGLFRNETDSICFSQHPLPGTPRPAAAAFNTLARVFGEIPFDNGQVLALGEDGVAVVFERESTSERLYVLWNRTLNRINVQLPAASTTATLYSMSNRDWVVTPDEGFYNIGLPAATQDSSQFLAPGQVSLIGGAPFILVETVPADAEPITTELVQLQAFEADSLLGSVEGGTTFLTDVNASSSTPIPVTPGALFADDAPDPLTAVADNPTAEASDADESNAEADSQDSGNGALFDDTFDQPGDLLRPTVDPANDSIAPVTTMAPLPLISPPTFNVVWSGFDESGIASYLVWVRVDGGEWEPWLEDTTDTRAEFVGEDGRRYEFAVWALDLAGNWSLNTDLAPQAATAVQE